MAVDHDAQKSLFDDALYCEEEKLVEVDEQEESEITLNKNDNFSPRNHSLFPPLLFQHDFSWDDEQLQSLFSKERETCFKSHKIPETGISSLSLSRNQAVEWILRINSHHGFSALTAILAVNFLDRFLFNCLKFQTDKPWMMQLVAVSCLSLAAKVEETDVPLLLDLQVDDDEKYLFEAKTIQRMELLVLSALKWRMNPVTPLSFLDHIVRRLGLKCYIHWEFLRSYENLILSVIADSRSMRYLPSVLATATMLHVIHQVEEASNEIEYEKQLLGVLKIRKEEVDDCYKLISDVLSNTSLQGCKNPLKRRICQIPSSPNGVIMDAIISSDSSNDSWEVSSSSPQPIFKKRRVQEQQMKLSPLSRVFLDAPQY